jgi:hypothetical protein
VGGVVGVGTEDEGMDKEEDITLLINNTRDIRLDNNYLFVFSYFLYILFLRYRWE